MTTTKPEWCTEYPEYDNLVESWGYEVLDAETFGSYQGDKAYLLSRNEGFGLLVIGYGSCSGCDELIAATPWDEDGADWTRVVELADRLESEIHWEESKQALMAWTTANPGNHWWEYDDDMRKWLNNHGAQLPTEEF